MLCAFRQWIMFPLLTLPDLLEDFVYIGENEQSMQSLIVLRQAGFSLSLSQPPFSKQVVSIDGKVSDTRLVPEGR